MLEFLESRFTALWKRRHRTDSLVGYLVLVAIAFLAAFFSRESPLAPEVWVIGLLLCWTPGVVSYFDARRIRRAPAGRCVVAVALRFGDGVDRTNVREDFLDELKKLIFRAGPSTRLAFLDVPEHICEQIDHSISSSEVAIKCNAHLLVSGLVKKRTDKNGRRVHVLELESLVAYRSNHPDAGELLKEEIRAIFPKHLEIPEDGAHVVFGQTAGEIAVAARYILGTAALVTGDLDFAKAQYEDAEQAIRALEDGNPLRAALASKLADRNQDWLLGTMHRSYFHWIKSADGESGLRIVHAYSQLANTLKQSDSVKLLYAAGLFIQNPTSVDARNIVKRLCNKDLVDARISQAFLRSFDGDFAELRKWYGMAIKGGASKRAWSSATAFTLRAIQRHPDRPYLVYALAFIRDHVDLNPAAAIELYERFCDMVKTGAPEHARAALQRACELKRAEPQP